MAGGCNPKYVCAACFGLPLLCLIILLSYYALWNFTPSCSIHELYIPALDAGLMPISNSSSVTFIFFDLQLDNHVQKNNIHYDFINPALAFYYGPTMIANYSVPRFSQRGDETAHLRDLVETRGMPWSDARSPAVFTVEFAARVKVSRVFWITGYKELSLRGDVEVNDSGEKVRNKDLKLKSISHTLTSLHSDDDDAALLNLYSV